MFPLKVFKSKSNEVSIQMTTRVGVELFVTLEVKEIPHRCQIFANNKSFVNIF